MRKPVIATIVAVAFAVGLDAQSTPPGQGTIALEGAMETFYKGLNAIVVTTALPSTVTWPAPTSTLSVCPLSIDPS